MLKLRLPIARIADRYRSVVQKVSFKNVVPLGSIHVNLYLYNKRGRLCISTATITTYDYYRLKGLSPIEAAEKARKHPLAVLRAGEVTIIPSMFSRCFYIDNALAQIAKKLIKRVPIIKEPTQISDPGATSLPSDVLLDLVYPDLYSKRYQPPDKWLTHVVPSTLAREAWYRFATRYSYGLLFPKNHYSISDALEIAMQQWYGVPGTGSEAQGSTVVIGVASMDELVHVLSNAHWNNQLAPGSILASFSEAPILMVNALCSTCNENTIGISLGFATSNSHYTTEGIVLFGVVTIPEPNMIQKLHMKPGGAYLGPVAQVGYIEAPMKDIYEADGIAVVYYVFERDINGEKYWEIMPLFRDVIIHYYDYDFSAMSSGNMDSDTWDYALWNAFNYIVGGSSFDEVEVLDKTIYDEFRNDTVVDNASISFVDASSLAGIVGAALNNVVNALLGYIPGGKLASKAISISIVDLSTRASNFEIDLYSGHTKHYIHVYANKLAETMVTKEMNNNHLYPPAILYHIYGDCLDCNG